MQIECEKTSLGSFFCTPLVSNLKNVIAKDIGQNADIRRICSFIRVCPMQVELSNDIEQRERNQRNNFDEVHSTLVESAANVNHSFVSFNLLFILSITYILN